MPDVVTVFDASTPILTRMMRYLEQLASSVWNRLQGRRQARKETGSTIALGLQVLLASLLMPLIFRWFA